MKVHLKIDTGMNRLGLKSKSEFEEVLHTCQKSIFKLMVFLHILQTADDELQNDAYEEQLKKFYEIIGDHSFQYIHCQNSAAMMYHNDEKSNIARIGIASVWSGSSWRRVTRIKTSYVTLYKSNNG